MKNAVRFRAKLASVRHAMPVGESRTNMSTKTWTGSGPLTASPKTTHSTVMPNIMRAREKVRGVTFAEFRFEIWERNG